MASFDEFGMIKTIDEYDDIPIENDSSESDDEPVSKKKREQNKKETLFNSSFSFDENPVVPVTTTTSFKYKAKGHATVSNLDEKIAKIRKEKLGNKGTKADEEDMSVEEDESSEDEDDRKRDVIRDKGKDRKRKKKKDESTQEEQVEFSETIDSYDEKVVFQDMNLSRPLLKGLASMGFVRPTPIQAACVPVALMGRDVCACAVTGSGKTVGFMLPIMERLLYRPRAACATRVLVLLPTRELAVQVHQVGRALAQHAHIDICLAAGGLDIKSQEAMLRRGPDVVIATPGRLIDHLHNSLSFTLNNIEILVLDEADRMLDEYFAEQMKEIIRLCAHHRQTMLFSATMTESVQELVAVSLKDPVKVFVNQSSDLALGLRQEFVRIRPKREGDREAIVAALVSRNFCDKCIVFIQTKVQAHRMHILLGLLGINVGELHGNLSQAQRLETLARFKAGTVDVMLATDLASRGLDIEGVKTVINFTMPSTVKHYVHRVGRTARAGKNGRSVTLVGEQERKVLKEVVKKAKTPLKTRIVPHEIVSRYISKIADIEDDIRTVMVQEKEESHLRAVENQMNKASNILERQSSGDREPDKRHWFQSRKERQAEKDALRLGDRTTSKKEQKEMKKTRKKITAEERAKFEITKSQLLSIRHMKKQMKEKPVSALTDNRREDVTSIMKKKKKSKKKKGVSGFEEELADIGEKNVKKSRAGPSFKERKEALGSSKKAAQIGRKKKIQR